MKQKLIILITLLSVSFYSQAQEYRLAKSNGQLKLNITGVIVEGYEGQEIIFSGQKVVTEETDERAKGLVPITSSKYVDNTGLGINVNESGDVISVNLVAKKPIGVLTIKVPNQIKVFINNNGNSNRVFFSYSGVSGANAINGFGGNENTNMNASKNEDEIVIKNMKSELEVSVYWNKIRLENNTGPMNIKTVTGSVDVIFSGDIKGPVSIISANSYVDVTLPASTKANIEMGTSYGKLFAGKEFKIDFEKLEPEKAPLNVRLLETRSTNRKTGSDLEAVTVVGHPAGTVTSATTSGSKEKNERAKVAGVKVDATGTISKVNGVEVKPSELTGKVRGVQVTGSGIHVLTGDNYTPASGTFSAMGYFSGGDRIKGKLNGGGIDLIFKSTNKNVYLRQQ